MKVVHISPTYFSPESVVGGAERYTLELAKAMARQTPTVLVSFGPKDFTRKVEDLTFRCYKTRHFLRGNIANPLSVRFLPEVLSADVIHCHQFMNFTTDLALVTGGLFRKKVFVTDLGGNTDLSASYHLPLWKNIRSFLFVSKFYCEVYRHLKVPSRVIPGGVDPHFFSPGGLHDPAKILYVGRIMPHKGIHDLVDALPENMHLDIVGSPEEAPHYYEKLLSQSAGRNVSFHLSLSDNAVVEKFQCAFVTVLPATKDSGYTTALESLACETPVIAAATGSLPDIIEEGLTGFLVPPNSPAALHERINYLVSNPKQAAEMGRRGRKQIIDKFSWDVVAKEYLKAYML